MTHDSVSENKYILSDIRTEEKMISKGYIKYFLPTLSGLLFSQLAPIVDSLCIAYALGDVALSGMSTVYPIISTFDMFAAMIGIGGGIVMAKAAGSGSREKAGRAFTISVISLAVVSIVLTALFFIFMDPVLVLLSITPDNLPYVKEYLTVFLSGAFALVFQLAFTYILTDDNNPNLAMIGGIVSAVVNVIVDYVGLIILRAGIWAAAFGTVFGMFIGCLVYLFHLRKKDRMCHFVWHSDRRSRVGLLEIIKPGVPQAISYVLVIIQGIQANYILESALGTSGLGNITVVYNVQIMAATIILAVTGAAVPMFATYHGEGNKDGIRIIKRMTLKFGILVFLPFLIPLLVSPQIITFLFSTEDPVMLATLPSAIRITAVSKVFMLINMLFCAHLQSTDKEMRAVIANVIQGVVQFAATFFLSLFTPEESPWSGMLIGYVTAGLYLVFCCRELKGVLSNKPENIRFIRGGKADETAVRGWYEGAKAFLTDTEAERVSETMIEPFIGNLPDDMSFNGTLMVLRKYNGDSSVILRYDSKTNFMDKPTENTSEEGIYNECIYSNLNAVRRIMISFEAHQQ